MKDKKQHWIDFYNELASLYDSLLNPEYSGASVLYQSSTAGFIPNTVNKHYRAVLNVGKETALIKDHIERAKALFYKAVAIDNKEHGTNRKPKLPVYMPYFLDNEDDIFKIQIHENKAHSSVNYKQDEMIPIFSCSKGSLSSPNEKDKSRSNEEVLSAAIVSLEDDGYTVETEHNEENPYYMLSVDVATMCDKYECDSIQRRSFTGRQIRANFFTTEDDVIQKSKLATVGVLLVTRRIEVVHSLQRSTRTDAKYIKKHPDEIIFDVVSKDLHTGRFYKRRNEVKA